MTQNSEHGPSGSSKERLKTPTAIVLSIAAATALAACGEKVEATPADPETTVAVDTEVQETPITENPETTVAVDTEDPEAPETPITQSSSPTNTELPSEIKTTEPVESEAPKSYEEMVADLEIESGLSAEEFGKRYSDSLHEQRFSIATEDLWERTFNDYSMSVEDIKGLIYEETVEAMNPYFDAIFVKDWRSQPSLVEVSDNIIRGNVARIYQWGFNHNRGYPDFKDWSNVTSVDVTHEEKNSEGTITARRMIINGTQHNNHDEIEQDVVESEAVDGAPFDIVIVTVVGEDGKERIVDYQ